MPSSSPDHSTHNRTRRQSHENVVPIDRIQHDRINQDRIRRSRPLLGPAASVLGHPGRLRPSVPLTDPVKGKIFVQWFLHGVPEKDLASIFRVRREDVELVVHELVLYFLGVDLRLAEEGVCSGPSEGGGGCPTPPAAVFHSSASGNQRRAA